MTYGTLELPCEMIAAARSYAESEQLSLVSLFGRLLSKQYGYKMDVTSLANHRQVDVPDSVKAFSGVIELPPGKSDEDLIREAIVQRYEEIS